jgi:hypothetical protein
MHSSRKHRDESNNRQKRVHGESNLRWEVVRSLSGNKAGTAAYSLVKGTT